MTKLISKSAKMAGIDRILLFPAQMTCIDNKTRDMRPNCVILADLEINLVIICWSLASILSLFLL